jgi:hypothetical protein
MLLVVIVVWAVLVGGCFAYAVVCGLRTYRRARAAQATLQGRMAVLEAEGLGTLEARTVELNQKLAEMQVALEGLEHSLAGLEVLTAPVSGVAAVLVAVRRIVRR